MVISNSVMEFSLVQLCYYYLSNFTQHESEKTESYGCELGFSNTNDSCRLVGKSTSTSNRTSLRQKKRTIV